MTTHSLLQCIQLSSNIFQSHPQQVNAFIVVEVDFVPAEHLIPRGEVEKTVNFQSEYVENICFYGDIYTSNIAVY